jgi:hypothetical protein
MQIVAIVGFPFDVGCDFVFRVPYAEIVSKGAIGALNNPISGKECYA